VFSNHVEAFLPVRVSYGNGRKAIFQGVIGLVNVKESYWHTEVGSKQQVRENSSEFYSTSRQKMKEGLVIS